MLLLKSIASLLLITIGYQDFKEKKVFVIQLIVLFGLSIIIAYTEKLDVQTVITNLGWIGIQLGILALYVWYVKRTAVLKVFGSGDILFLLCIAPLFNTHTLILFYISGLIIAAIVGFSTKAFSKTHDLIKIPLAGILGVWSIPFIWIDIDPFIHNLMPR